MKPVPATSAIVTSLRYLFIRAYLLVILDLSLNADGIGVCIGVCVGRYRR